MRKSCFTLLLALAVMLGWQTANAHHPREARVEMWTAPCPDDAYDDDAHLEVFLRLSERGYATVYQITPFGNVRILYPRAHHHRHELRADRIYRLSDLAEDVYLYDEEEGDAQIGVIYTPEPVVLAPWLERSFVEAGLVIRTSPVIYARYDFPRIFARVEAEVRLHLGTRCTPVFVVKPVYVRPRVICRSPERDYRHGRSKPHYKKRDDDKRGYEPRFAPKVRVPAEPERRTYERRDAEVRRVAYPARTPEREKGPVTSVSSPRSRRERNESSKQIQSRDEEKRSPSSRRGRENRADD